MTLEELFEADKTLEVVGLTHVLRVTLLESDFVKYSILDESRWIQSSVSGLYQRVDPARPQMKQLRHVHIASKKHLRAATKQAAWNSDGTRHDRKNFDDVFGAKKDVKAVAKAALGLPADFILEYVGGHANQVIRLLESEGYDFETHLAGGNIEAGMQPADQKSSSA